MFWINLNFAYIIIIIFKEKMKITYFLILKTLLQISFCYKVIHISKDKEENLQAANPCFFWFKPWRIFKNFWLYIFPFKFLLQPSIIMTISDIAIIIWKQNLFMVVTHGLHRSHIQCQLVLIQMKSLINTIN